MRRIWADGSVRLGNFSTRMCQSRAASVNSASAAAPFMNRHTPSGRELGGREFQKVGQAREGARGDESGRGHGRILNALGVDGDGRSGGTGGFAQERGFAMVGFDEIERQVGSDRQHEAREAGAAAKVDAAGHPGWQQRDQLKAVLDVAPRRSK